LAEKGGGNIRLIAADNWVNVWTRDGDVVNRERPGVVVPVVPHILPFQVVPGVIVVLVGVVPFELRVIQEVLVAGIIGPEERLIGYEIVVTELGDPENP
jgi:hypothetical protein